MLINKSENRSSMAVPGMMSPPPMSTPMSQVEISILAQNLRNKDAFSKSDPVCVLYMKETGQDRFFEVGRTEMIKDNLNPQWVKKFDLEYRFEERQMLQFRIYDWDNKSTRAEDQDSLGFVEVSLGEIMGTMGSQFGKLISGGTGMLKMIGEEMSSSKEVITMNFIGSDLDKKDFLGKSDPFLIFYRCNEMNVYTAVHKTEVIKNTLNPVWKTIVIPAKTLCAGDHNRSIKIECFDWDSDGGHDLIGECYTNVKSLMESDNCINEFINPKKKAKKVHTKIRGDLYVKV